MKRLSLATSAFLCGLVSLAEAQAEQKAQYFVRHSIEQGKHVYKYRVVKDVERKESGFTIGVKDDQNMLRVLPLGFIAMRESPSEFVQTAPKGWKGEVELQEESAYFCLSWNGNDKNMAVGLEEIAGFSVTLDKEDPAYESYEASGSKLIPEYSKPIPGAEFRLELSFAKSHDKRFSREKKLDANVTFAIPEFVEQTKGSQHDKNVEFSFRPLKQKSSVTCSYKWDQNQAKYMLSHCSDGRTVGDNALAGWFRLYVHGKTPGKMEAAASITITPLE